MRAARSGALYFVWRQLRTAGEALEATKVGTEHAARQLELTREQGRADSTAVLMERYHRLEFMEVWSRVGTGYLKVDGNVIECYRRIRAWDYAPHGLSPLITKQRRPPRSTRSSTRSTSSRRSACCSTCARSIATR
jgi:hypothetical protein